MSGRLAITLGIIYGSIGLADADNTLWGVTTYIMVAALVPTAYMIVLGTFSAGKRLDKPHAGNRVVRTLQNSSAKVLNTDCLRILTTEFGIQIWNNVPLQLISLFSR